MISITLKGVDARDFELAKNRLRSIIGDEAMRFQSLLESGRLSEEEKRYRQLIAIDSDGRRQFAMPDDALTDSLLFAVLTGCLRIALSSDGRHSESIFTGLNNLKVFSVTDSRFASCFGFISEDVRRLLEYYHLEEKSELAQEWYDGYCFGDTGVYSP